MTDLTKELKDVAEIHDVPVDLIEECHNIVHECLNNLKSLRVDLTHAYIVHSNIVTEAEINGKSRYLFELEEKVRGDGRKHQEADLRLRKEQKILEQLKKELFVNLLPMRVPPPPIPVAKHNKTLNFWQKITKLIKRLFHVKHVKKTTVPTPPPSDPAEIFNSNINTLKEYQKELQEKGNVFRGLIKNDLKKYLDRTVIQKTIPQKDTTTEGWTNKTQQHREKKAEKKKESINLN